MKLLVVGGCGREQAIIKKLKENPSVETIYALPGNGGIAADAVCVPIGATDIPRIVEFATQNKIDYAVVAPDDPLVLGAVDALTEKGSHSLMLEVRVSNTPAQKLYESLGFSQVGRRPKYYVNPREDALILRKEWSV